MSPFLCLRPTFDMSCRVCPVWANVSHVCFEMISNYILHVMVEQARVQLVLPAVVNMVVHVLELERENRGQLP